MTESHSPSVSVPDLVTVAELREGLFSNLGSHSFDRFAERERRMNLLLAVLEAEREEQKIQLARWSYAGHTAVQMADALIPALGVLHPSRIQQLVEEGRKLGGIPKREPKSPRRNRTAVEDE